MARVQAGRRAGRARRGRRRRAWPRCSSASHSAPRSRRSRRRPKSWTWQRVTVPRTSINHQTGDLRGALRDAAARTAPTSSSIRSAANCPSPRCARCAAAGDSSPSATPPASSPASRSTWCSSRACRSSGFQFQDVPPDEFASATKTELRGHLVSGRVRPHVGAVYPLAETVAALRHVADGRAIGKVLIDLTNAAS